MSLATIHRYAVNGFLAVLLTALTLDALPPTPHGLRLALEPALVRLGLHQGPWLLFAPNPDRVNMRLRAEIAYRDGEKRVWQSPDWRHASPGMKWASHRRHEWLDHITNQSSAPAWEPWCRHLARELRPDFPRADRGAEVRILYHEAPIPPAEQRPWKSIREAVPYDDGWVLTIESLE